ncbi:hypothetical protein Glove_46g139 [Diversispora epigaea]|uniref:Uncharacterized protein n=1 Tax=Diversispora epigaea TaxID=1348612 RepID=A0A397JFJ8_9GLOM|nr:hypothetical protein Glove_46g139 [Diversispora epigaea]
MNYIHPKLSFELEINKNCIFKTKVVLNIQKRLKKKVMGRLLVHSRKVFTGKTIYIKRIQNIFIIFIIIIIFHNSKKKKQKRENENDARFIVRDRRGVSH